MQRAARLREGADEGCRTNGALVRGELGDVLFIMASLLILAHLLGVLLAVAATWSIRFELKRKAVPLWRLFLPAAFVLLCALALLAGLSNRGRGILVVAFLFGLAAGCARAFWLRLRFDHAAKLVRLSPARDGVWMAAMAGLFAAIDVFVALRSEAGAPASPLFAAGAIFCAGYLVGRAVVTRVRARDALHLDMR